MLNRRSQELDIHEKIPVLNLGWSFGGPYAARDQRDGTATLWPKLGQLICPSCIIPRKAASFGKTGNRGAFLFRLWDCLARTRNLLRNEDEALFRPISRYTVKARATELSILEEHHEICIQYMGV